MGVVSMVHIYREGNGAANMLVKKAMLMNSHARGVFFFFFSLFCISSFLKKMRKKKKPMHDFDDLKVNLVNF